jgi:DNA-binding NarL/FixJ family response regulator
MLGIRSAVPRDGDAPCWPWPPPRLRPPSRAEAALQSPSDHKRTLASVRTVALSPRQPEVATLIWDGMTHGEVAHKLGMAMRTVDGHLVSIRVKTGGASTVAALVDLVRRGEL